MTEIASGSIKIDLNDAEALAGLRKVDAAFDKLMRDVERAHADAHIGVELKELEDGVANAKRRIRELDGRHANPSVDLDDKVYKARMKELQAELKVLDGRRAEVEIEVKGDKAAIDAIRKVEDAQHKLEKGVADVNKELEKSAELNKKNADAMEKQHRRAIQLDSERTRSLVRQQSEALRMDRQLTDSADKRLRSEVATHAQAIKMDRDRAAMEARELANVPKLQRAYANLQQQQESIIRRRSQAKGDRRVKFLLDIDERVVLTEMEKVHAELARIGEKPIHIPIEADTRGQLFGRALRKELQTGAFRRDFLVGGSGLGGAFSQAFKRSADRGITDSLAAVGKKIKRLPRLTASFASNVAQTGLAKLADAGKSLQNLTVRLGPFTATVRSAVVGLSVLGPVILDVVGALGALAAVVGSAALGGIGVLTAGAAGLGLVLGSTALILPQLTKGYKELGTTQKAYHNAQDQYGKGSKEATKALGKYKSALSSVSPAARTAFLGIQSLKTGIRQLGNDSQPAFDKTVQAGVNTGKSLLKTFGPEMTQSFGLVAKGVQAVFKGLNSAEAKNNIKQLFDNTQKSLPAFGSGLANLGRAGTNIAVAFSKVGPALGLGFKTWTGGILKFTQNGAKMSAFVNQSVTSLQKFGHFAQATGRLMAAFFGNGVHAGQGFLDTMTKAENRWTMFLQSTQGKKSTGSFFQESVHGAEALFAALAPILKAFVEWSAAIAPVTRFFLAGVAAVAQFVSAITSLVVLRGPLEALGATLGVLWGLGKIGGAVRAVAQFGIALTGVSTVEKALAMQAAETTGALNAQTVAATRAAEAGAMAGRVRGGVAITSAEENVAMASGGGVVRAGVQAEGAAVKVSKLARAGAIAERGLTGLGAATIGVGSATAGLGILAVGAAAGIYLLATRTKDYENANKSADVARRATYAGLKAIPGATLSYAQAELTLQQTHLGTATATRTLAAANKELNRLEKAGKTGGDAYTQAQINKKQAVLDLRQARISENQAAQEAINTQKQLNAVDNATLGNSLKGIKGRKDALAKLGGETLANTAGTGLFSDLNGKKIADAYALVSKQAKAAGQSVTDYMKTTKDGGYLTKDAADKLSQYAKSQTQINNAMKLARTAYDSASLGAANLARISKGQEQINAASAASFGALRRAAGKYTANVVATRFTDPGAAGRVGAAAASAAKAGVSAKEIRIIVTGAKTAESAIQRLNQQHITAHELRIITSGHQGALAALRSLIGVRLAPKALHIITSTADAAHKIAALRALGIPRKTAIILGNNVDALNKARQANTQKMATLFQTIQRQISNPPNLFQNLGDVFQRIVRTVTKKGGADGGAFASGGQAGFGSVPSQRQQERAAARANRSPQRAVSQKVTRPKYLVGEQATPEYVIATNPAYRRRNLDYLSQAADALGAEVTTPGYAAGHGHHRRSVLHPAKGTPGHNRPDSAVGAKHYKVLGVPKQLKVGGVDIGPLQTTLSAAHGLYKTRDAAVASARKKVRTAEEDYKNTPAKKRKGKKKHLETLRDDFDNLYYGDKKSVGPKRHSLSDLRAHEKDAKARFDAVHKINNEMEKTQTLANTEATKMDTASTLYSKTGSPGALADWNTAHNSRNTLLGVLAGLFKNAAKYAAPGSKFQLGLLDSAATATSEQTTNTYTDAPTGPEAPAPPTLDDIIAQYQNGTGTKTLSDLLYARENAKLDNTSDPASFGNDSTAAQNIVGFFTGLVDSLSGASVPTDVKTAAVDALISAKDDLAGTVQTPDNNPNLSAQLDQSNLRNAILTNTSNINAAALSAFASSGDLGSGASNAFFGSTGPGGLGRGQTPLSQPSGTTDTNGGWTQGGGTSDASTSSFGTIININTLHPGDPATLSAIGDAATSGMALQGYVPTSTFYTGN